MSNTVVITILLGVALSVIPAIFYLVLLIKREGALRAKDSKREFHSEISDLRARLEEQSFMLQRELSENRARFSEVNHLILSGQRANDPFTDSDGSQHRTRRNEPFDTARFLEALRIDPRNIKVDPTLVFVLTPFSRSQQNVYDAIVDAFSDTKLTVLRGDERHIEGEILPSIVEYILRSRLVIANIEGRTPNVMYELGIAHAFGKDVFVLAGDVEGADQLPFDFRSRRVIFYQGSQDLVQKIRTNVIRQFFT